MVSVIAGFRIATVTWGGHGLAVGARFGATRLSVPRSNSPTSCARCGSACPYHPTSKRDESSAKWTGVLIGLGSVVKARWCLQQGQRASGRRAASARSFGCVELQNDLVRGRKDPTTTAVRIDR